MVEASKKAGLLWGLSAYLWWGGMPLYFWMVQHVPAQEILAHRIVWCAVLLAGLLSALRHWPIVRRHLFSPRTALALFACSLLLAVNWFAYIYGALTHRIMQASLGYFLMPVFNIVLGVLVFRERLRPAQVFAVLLAAAGVLYLVRAADEFHWIALTISTSFATYGVIRKLTPVDGLTGLFIETLFLAPLAAGFVLWWWLRDEGTLLHVGWRTDALLLASGPITAVPLLCFGQAARLLPLTTIGFLQYLAPSLQFFLGWWWFGEPFTREKQVTFGLIWFALAIVVIDSLVALRRGLSRTIVEEIEPVEG